MFSTIFVSCSLVIILNGGFALSQNFQFPFYRNFRGLSNYGYEAPFNEKIPTLDKFVNTRSVKDMHVSKHSDYKLIPANNPEYPCEEENDKEEVVIHKPAPIIVKRPPTNVVVNHPPVVIRPAPVVYNRPPKKVIHKPVVKTLPRPVQVSPVLVHMKQPVQRKVFVEKEPPCPENYYQPKFSSFAGASENLNQFYQPQAYQNFESFT